LCGFQNQNYSVYIKIDEEYIINLAIVNFQTKLILGHYYRPSL